MQSIDEARKLLFAAIGDFEKAKNAGDAAAAAQIERETIVPLETRIAFLALISGNEKIAGLNQLTLEMEQALARLQRTVNGLFLGTLFDTARQVGVKTPPPAVTTPPPPDRETTGGGGGTTTGLTIAVTENDIDALARVAQSEVGHFGKYGADQLSGGVRAVVDTVFNRIAHKGFPLHGGPDTIEGVINDPFQFSAINATGSWEGLPAASGAVETIIREHVMARAAGQPSEIGGATHFLNPHLSSQSALQSWGQFVVDNAVAVYGSEAKKDVHYHGFPPNAKKPGAYTVQFGAAASAFSPDGVSGTGALPLADMREKIRALCLAELKFFESGKKKEGDDPQFRRVGEYWDVLGLALDGKSSSPWSAAFVSWVLKQAGAGDRFRYAQAHCHYFQTFVTAPTTSLYEALPADTATPSVGDILHYGRGSAKQLGFIDAQVTYAVDSFYPSHSDIVVAVDTAGGKVTTVGGNVSDSVNDKTFRLDGNGRLVERVEDGKKVPWIGMLRLRG